jgi:hypothetical protein
MRFSIKNIFMTFQNNKALIYWVLLGCFFLLGLSLRWEALEVVRLNQWLTRDIDRAINLFQGNYFPLVGPETTNGLRLPGPFLYILMAIPLWFHESYESIFSFYSLLNFSSLLISFYVVRKYFNFNIAFLTAALQSTHLLYIEAIAFPINPTFLLLLIPFLLWSVLEFTLNKNEKAVPVIVLIVSLGVQIHLSIATFLLTPLISGLIFRIKVSIKTILKAILICLITFSSFLFYLNNSYKPTLSITHVTKFDPFSSFLEPLKILAVQNTVNRLGDFMIGQGNSTNFLNVSDIYTFTQLVLLNISLLGLALFIIFKIKKGSIQHYKKATIVFLFFYCPAIIYDLIRPWDRHFWYNYIFILPAVLLISFSLNQLPKFFTSTSLKSLSKLAVIFIIIYLSISNVKIFHNSKTLVQKSSQIGNYQNFNALKKFYSSWSDKINIPIDQIPNRAFIEGIQSSSPNFFGTSSFGKNIDVEKDDRNKTNTCFYIIDNYYIFQNKQKIYPSENKRFDLFLTDPTIKIISTQNHLIKDKWLYKLSGLREFRVYEYKPNFDQPCYQNSWSTFPSSPKDKILLNDYFQFQKNNNIFFDKSFELDTTGHLKNLKINYIFKNDSIEYPIRFKIHLNKLSDGYKLNSSVDSYSWGISNSDQFNFKELSFTILTNEKDKKKFQLISKNSFISHGFGINQEKFSWYRTYNLRKDINFSKNKYSIKVSGKIDFINRKIQDEKNFEFIIPLELQK